MTDGQKQSWTQSGQKLNSQKHRIIAQRRLKYICSFLINAPTLQSLDFAEVVAGVRLSDSLKTELSKMVNLYDQLKLNKISLVKFF
jgi:hypothetical protein